MFKNPIINALLAEAYIILLFSGLQHFLFSREPEDTILIPIVMVSLFVLSALVMGFLFLSRPAELYLNSKKRRAVNFFAQTVVTFAVTTFIVVAVFIKNLI